MPQVVTISFPFLLPRLIGHARVSTDGQLNDAQIDELRDAACHRIH